MAIRRRGVTLVGSIDRRLERSGGIGVSRFQLSRFLQGIDVIIVTGHLIGAARRNRRIARTLVRHVAELQPKL